MTTTTEPRDPDAMLDTALSVLRRWYYGTIREFADLAIEAITGRVVGLDDDHPEVLGHLTGIEIAPGQDRREFLRDWLLLAFDGHSFLTIPRCTKAALLASDNEDAYEQEYSDDTVDPVAKCQAAMLADVWEYLDARKDEWEAKPLTVDELRDLASITLTLEPDHTPVKGNVSAIDEATDRETEALVNAQLDSGNQWAWCIVTVTAEYDGTIGMATLGGCSYESERQFRATEYENLLNEALDSLADNLAHDGKVRS